MVRLFRNNPKTESTVVIFISLVPLALPPPADPPLPSASVLQKSCFAIYLAGDVSFAVGEEGAARMKSNFSMPNAERARPVDRFRFAYSIKSISQFAIVDTSASDFAASPDNLSVIISP